MNFEIVKLPDFNGEGATIYSIILENDEITLLDHFIEENEIHFQTEVNDIVKRIPTIGGTTGARSHFFKENEGIPGDGVCALYDNPDSNLRLYCIRYGSCAVILGGRGPKPKTIKALQEDEKLTEGNYLMREVSKKIKDAMKERDIRWSADGMELIGDLNFTHNE